MQGFLRQVGVDDVEALEDAPGDEVASRPMDKREKRMGMIPGLRRPRDKW